jgi:hypothetical protein
LAVAVHSEGGSKAPSGNRRCFFFGLRDSEAVLRFFSRILPSGGFSDGCIVDTGGYEFSDGFSQRMVIGRGGIGSTMRLKIRGRICSAH